MLCVGVDERNCFVSTEGFIKSQGMNLHNYLSKITNDPLFPEVHENKYLFCYNLFCSDFLKIEVNDMIADVCLRSGTY